MILRHLVMFEVLKIMWSFTIVYQYNLFILLLVLLKLYIDGKV